MCVGCVGLEVSKAACLLLANRPAPSYSCTTVRVTSMKMVFAFGFASCGWPVGSAGSSITFVGALMFLTLRL